MTSIHTFIISWSGQHLNAEAIARAVHPASDAISMVYSDPDPQFCPNADCRLVRRPNHLFWGDKFQACLEFCTSDILLVIHADCRCDDWSALVFKCREALLAHSNIGVWAPLIDYTPWPLKDTQIGRLRNSNLNIVAATDAIVFAIRKDSCDRMKKAFIAENIYGWGIDWMFTSYNYANKKIAVVDRSIAVTHPRTRGYSWEQGTLQEKRFLETQLTLIEKIHYKLLWSYVINRQKQRPPIMSSAKP
jgi:hypothetical protein